MIIKIDKGVPIETGVWKEIVEALKKMEVGDSIELPLSRRSGLHIKAKKAGVKITTRQTSKEALRAWRIE